MSAKRILLIDDEKHLSAVITVCLQKIGGWTVLTAESGEAGLQLAEMEQPDAILLDVMMPDMDGLIVLQRLKSNLLTQAIPVLLLTAKVRSIGDRESYPLDVVSVLTKPFDPLKLVTQITQVLGW